MTSLWLLLLAVALMAGGAHLRRADVLRRSPRLALATWLVLPTAALLALVLAGLTQIVPASMLGGSIAQVLHACLWTLQAAYAAPRELPGVALAATLTVAGTGWAAACVVAELLSRARQRRHVRRTLAAVASRDEDLGATVLHSDAAAVYCVPGRGRSVVVTTGALRALDEEELEAVLAHERAHLAGRHHVPVAVAHGLRRAFPRVPLFATAAAEVDRAVEELADDAAARRTDRTTVAGALVTLAGMHAPAPALAAAASLGAVRVRRLLQPSRPLTPLQVVGGAAALTATIALPIVLAVYPAVAASVAEYCVMPPVG